MPPVAVTEVAEFELKKWRSCVAASLGPIILYFIELDNLATMALVSSVLLSVSVVALLGATFGFWTRLTHAADLPRQLAMSTEPESKFLDGYEIVTGLVIAVSFHLLMIGYGALVLFILAEIWL